MKLPEGIGGLFDTFVERKKLTPADLIQVGVLISLLLTICITQRNIEQQGEFNRNAFRPWLYIEFRNEIEITEERIIFYYDLRCDGNSPAYSTTRYEATTYDSIFPVKKFKELKRNKIKNLHTIGIIAPGTKKDLDDHRIIYFEEKILIDSLKQLIDRKKLLIHIYIEYSDFKKNRYCLRCTSFPSNLNDNGPNQYKCEWSIIDARENCID